MIGEELRKARQSAGMSQEALAERLAVSRQTISNWENERSYPDIERVIRLSELYHLSLDDLLRGDQRLVKSWVDATNLVRTGRLLALMLVLNLLLTVAIVVVSHLLWLSGLLFLLLTGSVLTAFILLIKLI